MNALLNLLNKLGKRKASHLFLLFRNKFNKFNIKCSSTYVSFYLSYDIKLALKSHFLCEILSLCTLCCYRHHYITLLNL